MPAGRTHNLINSLSFVALGGAALALRQAGQLTLEPVWALHFTWAFFVGTFLLSPDLDLAEGRVDSKRRWGPLGWLWVPYGRMFSHRGLSHTWVVGPLTRLVYLVIVAALLGGAALALARGLLGAEALAGLQWTGIQWPELQRPGFQWPGAPAFAGWLLPAAAGYYLSQWLHLIADGVAPDHGWQRRRRR